MRRRRVAKEFEGRATFDRRTFLLLPGWEERPVYDDYVISHRIAAARAAPELGFALPKEGAPYPRSSLPAQLLAQRVRARAPGRLDALEDALFRAAFVGLEDTADPAVLRACAAAAGVEPAEVDAALEDPALLEQASREMGEAARRGIDAVPALLVPGATPIVGAVSEEIYRDAIARALR